MSAAALTLAAVMALATDPACGAAQPQSEIATRLVAIATRESGRRPYAIGINADRQRRLPADSIVADSAQEAAAIARALLAGGRSIDVGLLQISDRNLQRHGLTLETAFDPCQSMRAGAEHYRDDLRSVWSLAHSRYNCGRIDCGQAYAASVESIRREIAPALATAAVPVTAPEPPRPRTLSYGRTASGRTMTYGR